MEVALNSWSMAAIIATHPHRRIRTLGRWAPAASPHTHTDGYVPWVGGLRLPPAVAHQSGPGRLVITDIHAFLSGVVIVVDVVVVATQALHMATDTHTPQKNAGCCKDTLMLWGGIRSYDQLS